MKYVALVLSIGLLISCSFSKKRLTAQNIIDKAIAKHCSNNCDNASITFTFRNKVYENIRHQGTYTYASLFKRDDTLIKDLLTNTSFKRFTNGNLTTLDSSKTIQYANNLNSVIYFSQLPYGLNAPAVKKELLNSVEIKGKTYYKIGVTFRKEGGGKDYQDRFIYWFDTANFNLDYLAYAYTVNGGGVRFRAAHNRIVSNGITFQDYTNYKPLHPNITLNTIDQLYIENKLKLVSKIELETIEVVLN